MRGARQQLGADQVRSPIIQRTEVSSATYGRYGGHYSVVLC